MEETIWSFNINPGNAFAVLDDLKAGALSMKAAFDQIGSSANASSGWINTFKAATSTASTSLNQMASTTTAFTDVAAGFQELADRASAAGIDISQFTDLQAKAALTAAQFEVAQNQAAVTLDRANAIASDVSSSQNEVALAQSKAALAAEQVTAAELSANDAMNMVQGEATRLADALEASSVKSNIFVDTIGSMREGIGGLVSGFTGAIGSVLDFGTRLGMTVIGIQMSVQMAVGAIQKASSMIGDFQQGLTKLTTTAGESTNNIKMVGDGMLAMAGPTATSVKDLGDAMYWVESGGAHGAAALTDLQIAAMGAKDENANLTDVTKALMFTLNNYGDTGLTAAGAMNTLIAATGEGELTLQGLTSAVSNVMPTAHTFGISLTDVTAGLATMSMQGDDASAAATHLAMMIRTLEAPSKAGASAIASIGLTTQQVTDEMRVSLPGALDMIVTAMKTKFPEGSSAYNEALKAISGGSRSMQAILETTGTHLDIFKQNVDKINSAVKAGGNSIAGWSEVQDNFNFRMQQASAAVGAFVTKVGTALAPAASALVSSFFNVAIPALQRFGDWFVSTGIPAIGKFSAFLKENFGDLIPVIEDIARQIMRLSFSNWETELPVINEVFTVLGNALKNIIIPAIQQFTMDLDKLLQWLNNTSIQAQAVRDILIGIGVAFATINIAAFLATVPALVAGFIAWAGAATAAAIATVAATWPILAIGAAIALIVGGIILAVQHWGDIMGWITGKTEQTRIKVEQDHNKMAIAQDENTAKGAQKAIDNYEIEKQGILRKLAETHDPAKQAELQHQLSMTAAQEQGQQERLQKADEDKKKQLAKQQELHAEMLEAQKPWYQRMLDAIGSFFGNIGHWFADRFTEAKNGIITAFGSIGQWFADRWADIEGIWGNVGKWFQDRFADAKNGIITVFGSIGQWFADRWNELPSPLKATLAYIGDVFQTLWNIIVAIFGKLGNWFADRWADVTTALANVGGWFHDRFMEAWNFIVTIFTPLGNWFSDRWVDVQNVFKVVGGWFHDRFMEAWNFIVTIFTPLGNWFSDRWNEVMGGINTFKNDVGNAFNDLKNSVVNIFHDMINGIIDYLNDGISGLESFINFFGQGLDNIAKGLGTKGTIPVAHLGRIPHYASGTDAHPGGPAIVGEQGRELVFLPPGAQVASNAETEHLLALMGGSLPSYAGGIGDIAKNVMNWIGGGASMVLDNMIKTMHITAPNLGGMTALASALFDKVKAWAMTWIQSLLPKFSSGSGTGGGTPVNVPGDVQSWISAAIALTGVPASWAGPLATIAMHESGGSPTIVNTWDSNAAAGTPSMGLFQVIGPTFAAHEVPGHGNILNPIDNAAAAIEYILGRYGSVFNVPGIVSMSHGGGYVGYAGGGLITEPIAGFGLRTGTRYSFGEAGNEMIVPISQPPSPLSPPSGIGGNDQTTQLLAQAVSYLAQMVQLQQQRRSTITQNNTFGSGAMNAQQLAQSLQSMFGYGYESMQRGGF